MAVDEVQTRGGDAGYQLRFPSLYHSGRACSFPCDADGKVCEDELSDRAKAQLETVRELVGREWGHPTCHPTPAASPGVGASPRMRPR